MHLSITQDNLARALSIVGRAVASKSTIPALTNVYLRAERTDEISNAGQAVLVGNNLECAITCTVPATVEEHGATTIPARLFSEIVNSLPKGNVELSVNKKTWTTTVKGGKHRGDIRGIDPDEYPPLPTVEGEALCEIGGDTLKTAVNQVIFSAARDDSRPVLAGVLLEFSGETLTLACADGFKLATRRVTLSQPVEPTKAIIPASIMAEVARVCGGSTVRLTRTDSQVLFEMGSVTLVARRIEGTFPNYQQIIPKEFKSTAVADIGELAKAVKLASYFSSEDSHATWFACADNVMTVKAVGGTGEGETNVDIALQGEPGEIAFNDGYFLQALAAGLAEGAEQVELRTNAASMPGMLRVVGRDDWQCVIMPLHTAR